MLYRNAFAFLMVITLLLAAGESLSAPLVLNEYNAVREDKFLDEGGVDTRFGTVLGNGSFGAPVGERNDWVELVVIADHLDIRGWELQMVDDGNPQPPLVFSGDSLWADLSAGTIITIFESDDIPEDLAYDPAMGDWTIEVRANDDASGIHITASDFDVTNNNFQLTIVDAEGRIMFGPAGEGISPPVGVGNGEIFELEADPSALITPNAPEYDDGKSSTFGAPNQWDAGTVEQDFSALRGGNPILDADFDGIADCRDSCRDTWNLVQTNTDGDGFGNACDCDFDQNGSCNISDFNLFLPDFQSAVDSGSGTDMDGSGSVGIDDFNLFLPGFVAGAPGPGPVGDPACDAVDPTEVLFDPDRLLHVNVTMTAADWDALRTQTRDLVTNVLPCPEVARTSPFTFFHADVTIDGTTVQDAGVRKKGFQGSLTTARPSLKIDFTEFVPGQQYQGMDRLTLNNNRQDTSGIQTCLAYRVLRQAGVPAPRCNFAHVTVNGQDLGIYSNVESIKSAFLVRNFGNAAGNVYEGTTSDLRAGHFGTFEIKNGGDRNDLLALAHLLEGTDAEILAGIDQHMDVDAFLTFWAMEGLIGHWDGYDQGNNNFWVHNDPATKFRFIPWGADATFGGLVSFVGESLPISPAVFLNSQLAVRLYGIPSLRQQYLDRLIQLRNTHFPQGGDPALLAEIDQMELLTNDPADPGSDPVVTGAIAAVRQWVADRYDHVEAEIGPNGTNPPPAPNPGSLPRRACLQVLPSDGVSFDIDVLATNNPAQVPILCSLCQSSATVYGITYQGSAAPLQAFDPNQNPVGRDAFGLLNLMITWAPQAVAIAVSVDPSLVTEVPGTVTIPDGLGNATVVLLPSIFNPGAFIILGLLTNTELAVTSFGTNPGDRVTGQLTSDVATFTLAPANPLPPLPAGP